MPELPEVETTKRGIMPLITGRKVQRMIVRNPNFRWKIPANIAETVKNRTVKNVERRAKYLLIGFDHGAMILHLGMSGSLRVISKDEAPQKHDHVDIEFSHDCVLRLRDPRRFGCVLWSEHPVNGHELFETLGPEPFSNEFNAEYLYQQLRSRTCSIKSAIMNNAIVVGVGNIYASESLFRARIRPTRRANRVNREDSARLATEIRAVLALAIEAGGTTLKDFVNAKGNPGYFEQKLMVYGRANLPCFNCKKLITSKIIGQRNTFYCTNCQT